MSAKENLGHLSGGDALISRDFPLSDSNLVLFNSCLWKDVGDGRDEDIGAPDALLDQAPQGLSALQPWPAVHNYHAELLVLLEGFTQDVVDER